MMEVCELFSTRSRGRQPRCSARGRHRTPRTGSWPSPSAGGRFGYHSHRCQHACRCDCPHDRELSDSTYGWLGCCCMSGFGVKMLINRAFGTAIGVALTLGFVLGSPTVANAAGYPTISVQRVVASGLDTPWGLAFLPDGSALISERDSGKIKRIDPRGRAGSNVTTVGRIKGVQPGGDGCG